MIDKIWTESELKKLATNRLMRLLKSYRAQYGAIGTYAYCDCCGEFYGSDAEFKEQVTDPRDILDGQIDLIKQELAIREHVETSKRVPNMTTTSLFKNDPGKSYYSLYNRITIVGRKKKCTLCGRRKGHCKGHFPHEYKISGKKRNIKRKRLERA